MLNRRDLVKIWRMPETMNFEHPQGTERIHQSCFRAYVILETVRTLLREEVPPLLVLQLITLMEVPIKEAEYATEEKG